MKPLPTLLVTAAIVIVLGLLIVGFVFSVTAGRPNWWLLGLFLLDSLAVLSAAARIIFPPRRRRGFRSKRMT